MTEIVLSTAIPCRLCLCSTTESFNLYSEKLQEVEFKEKIFKYLYVEIPDDDQFTKNICIKCINYVEQFHGYFSEVEANQEILHFSRNPQSNNDETLSQQPIILTTNDKSQFIQLTGYSMKNENYIVTLQRTIDGQESATINLEEFVPIQEDGTVDNNSIIINHDEIVTMQATGSSLDLSSEILQNHNTMLQVIAEKPEDSPDPDIENNIITQQPDIDDAVEITDARVVPTTDINTKKHKRKAAKEKEIDTKIKEEDVMLQVVELKEEDDESDDEIDKTEIFNDIADDLTSFVYDDENASEQDDFILYESNEQFAGFPKVLVKDAKLLISGGRLLELMSKFYRLDCDLCPEENTHKGKQKFSRLHSLCKHYNEEHSIKGYVVCCGTKLIKPRAMALHMARHLQPDAFTCHICDKVMTSPKILQYHLQNHLPEDQRPLACPDCPRKFSYSSALLAHSISHKPEDQREAHICDECGKSFSSPGRLSTHINVSHINHGHDFICHICAKQFSCRGNLTYHLTTHQPRIHQVQCEECGKWLKNKLCLRKHKDQHSLVRHACPLCEYTAVNRQCLRNHTNVQHSDIKPFSCQECGKTFKLRNTLTNHMVQHTGIRKYSCEFCQRPFASSGNYYSHRKRMHPMELQEVKQKKEQEEEQLRAEVFGQKNVKVEAC